MNRIGLKKKLITGIVSLALAAGIAIPVSVNHFSRNESEFDTTDSGSILQVHFIDVGQGDSILIRQGEESMLIDAGENKAGNKVVEYCKNQGITELEYVVGTHPHEDHIGGMDDVINNIDVNEIMLTKSEYTNSTYEDVLSAAKEHNVKEIYPATGEIFSLGDAVFTIMAPNRSDYLEVNNESLVIKMTYGNVSYLFCGDAEIESEYDMVENGVDLSADVIKLGHHGSNTSSSQMILKTVKPSYAIISVGKDNSYRHPAAEILNRLKEYGIRYFRTDKEGNIISVTDGKNISFNNSQYEKVTTSDETMTNENHSDKITTNEIQPIEIQPSEIQPDNGEENNYVLNNNTKKFHRTECRSGDDISESNREDYIGDREELINKGYSPCKICNP